MSSADEDDDYVPEPPLSPTSHVRLSVVAREAGASLCDQCWLGLDCTGKPVCWDGFLPRPPAARALPWPGFLSLAPPSWGVASPGSSGPPPLAAPSEPIWPLLVPPLEVVPPEPPCVILGAPCVLPCLWCLLRHDASWSNRVEEGHLLYGTPCPQCAVASREQFMPVVEAGQPSEQAPPLIPWRTGDLGEYEKHWLSIQRAIKVWQCRWMPGCPDCRRHTAQRLRRDLRSHIGSPTQTTAPPL